MKKILSLFFIFVIISQITLNTCAQNQEKVLEKVAADTELIAAKITRVPLGKRVVFGFSPETPEGITVELTYSDGTIVSEKIVSYDNKYYVSNELVEEATIADELGFGIEKAGYFLSQGQIYISYSFLLIPIILF